MRKTFRIGLTAIILILAAIQLVPVKRYNPPGEPKLTIPADVRAVLERSCFDCHSNETDWPWYSRVAPGSWRVTADVNEARDHINFSEWDNIPASRKDHLLHEIWEEVEQEKMPLKSYLALHPEARLTDSDRTVLRRWTVGGEAGGPGEASR